MDDRCDICGDIGVVDAIITCHKCKIAREHLYCMRVVYQEPPPYWSCETCEHGKEAILPTSVTRRDLLRESTFKTSDKVHIDPKQSAAPHKFQKNLRKGFFDWEKKVQTGRTKYISVQEALKLPSGSNTSGSAVKSTCDSGPVLPKTKHVKTPVKPKTPPLKFTLLQNEVKHSGKSAVQALSVKKHIHMAQLGDGLKHIAEGKRTQTRVKEAIVSQAPSKSSGCAPSIISGSYLCANLEHRTSDAKKENQENSQPNVNICYSGPAQDASWKGSFKILDGNFKNEGLCHVIQAYPPSRVRQKLYDFSRRMPEVLQFELIPRGNLFKDRCPDKDDIGLFFFPSKSERSENYSSLLEFIGMKNLVMRMCMYGVELLVLTSTLFRTDCQRWNGEYFFWGLFHRVEKTKTSMDDTHNILVACAPNEVHNDCVEGDNEEVVDMEIDMVGGEIVGIVDIPIPREPFREGSDIHGASGECPLSYVKRELSIDIPPGFEKMSKLGVNYSPASAENTRLCIDIPPGFKKISELGVTYSPASAQSIRLSTGGEAETPSHGICSETDKKVLGTSKSKDFPSYMHARSASMASCRHDDGNSHPTHVKVKSENQ